MNYTITLSPSQEALVRSIRGSVSVLVDKPRRYVTIEPSDLTEPSVCVWRDFLWLRYCKFIKFDRKIYDGLYRFKKNNEQLEKIVGEKNETE